MLLVVKTSDVIGRYSLDRYMHCRDEVWEDMDINYAVVLSVPLDLNKILETYL